MNALDEPRSRASSYVRPKTLSLASGLSRDVEKESFACASFIARLTCEACELKRDELATRIAAFEEPIGINQSPRVVVRRRIDGFDAVTASGKLEQCPALCRDNAQSSCVDNTVRKWSRQCRNLEEP